MAVKRVAGVGQIHYCTDATIRASLGITATTPLRVVAPPPATVPPILWLRLPDGRETLISTRYLTDPTAERSAP